MNIDAHCGRNVIHIQVVRYILVVSCTTPKTGAPHLFENKKKLVWLRVLLPPIRSNISPTSPFCMHYLHRSRSLCLYIEDVYCFMCISRLKVKAPCSLWNITAFIGLIQNCKFWNDIIFIATPSWQRAFVEKFMVAHVLKKIYCFYGTHRFIIIFI